MAVYSRREIVTRTVEYVIPSGHAIAEFHKACHAARNDYWQLNDIDVGDAPVSDDWARVYARDNEVVIAFEVKGANR